MSDKKDKRELFEQLNEALDRVIKGEDIEKVLPDYPHYADEIRPLLKTAADTHSAALIKPRPEFRQRAALEFQRAIQNMPVKEKATQPARRWRLSLVAPLAALLAVLLAGTGTVAAASYSLPGDTLYSVKLATESMQIALAPTDLGKAELYAKFNDRRVDELVRIADKDIVSEISALNSRIESNLNNISELTGGEAVPSGGTNMLTFGTSAMPDETTVAATQPPQTYSTTTALPSPTTTVAPSSEVPTIAAVPTTTVAVPPQDSSRSESVESQDSSRGDEKSTKSKDKEQKLLELLFEKQIKNLEALLKSYERASERAKPQILESIRIIVSGYGLTADNESTITELLWKYDLSITDLFQ